jgi:hypothetical protein
MTATYEEIVRSLHAIDTIDFDVAQKNDLVLALRKALVKVESPWQKMQKIVWESVIETSRRLYSSPH